MKSFDAVLIFDCTNTNSQGRQRTNVAKPLAPFAIHNFCTDNNIPCTLINYVDFWDPTELAELLVEWCKKHNVSKPLIACSALFNPNVLAPGSILSTIETIEQKLNVLVAVGGPSLYHHYDFTTRQPDFLFQGRSLYLFERWVLGKQIPDTFVKNINGTTVFSDETGAVVENPIVLKIHDDFCLDKNDILHFEIRIGCKFNCSFCNHEFRNAKKVNDTVADKLVEFFQTAYDKFGITRFSCTDDTFNEEDSKIHTLHSAVKQLSFKPKIVGFNRFDVLMARPYQADLMNECGFVGHFFGIESLHDAASKNVRKTMTKERAYTFLTELRKKYPDWFIATGYILGIPPETHEHIESTMQELRTLRYFDSIMLNPLTLENASGRHNLASDIEQHPEKYGITTVDIPGKINMDWYHQYSNYKQAVLHANRLTYKNLKEAGITRVDPWEALSYEAVGFYSLFTQEGKEEFRQHVSARPQEALPEKVHVLSKEFITQYMQRKKDYIRSL